MEVPGENTTHEQKQKDYTKVIAKGISPKEIKKYYMDAPMKNVAEDLPPAPSLQSRKHSKTTTSLEAFQDEEDKAVAAASKESLKNDSRLNKELDASKGAPSLDMRTHSKATTILEAFLVVDAMIEIMRHDHPNDIRDEQLVYIERVAGIYMLERDGKDASLPPYEEFINGLNTQQRMYIQLIGLGGLLKTPSIKIRRVLCLTIANSYDAKQDAFTINLRPCWITLEDVAHIRGMPCDGKKHIPSNLDDNMELWKPFILYTIGKYVCRTKEEYVHNKYIGIVRNVETMRGKNLGQLRLDYLMYSVKNYVNGEAILEGNLPLLQYVEDLMRPSIPAQDGTLAKPKTGAQVVEATIEIMRHDEPIDTRDGQLVYIERVAGVAKLERDGRIEKCYEDALASILGTTQGTSYLKHHMVFLPPRSLKIHLSLVVVNPRRKEIQVLDSLFYCTWDGCTSESSDAKNGIESNAWEDINVMQWPVPNIIVPKGDESALYMLKNIELFTREKQRMQYDQMSQDGKLQ
ncbi:hypothetical protein D1007_12379 [Hordeum vulgare]|nr:hypothetical protein D1007_12379 [Hordeum vulgare]